MNHYSSIFVLATAVTITLSGCGGNLWPLKSHSPGPISISAVRLSPGGDCEPQGIPYYLPKPLLVVSKNFRHIDDAKIGLTRSAAIPNSFDNQSSYADIAANISSVEGGSMGANGINGAAGMNGMDGDVDINRFVGPAVNPALPANSTDSFFTYQIVMIPDLSQKYGLNIQGGPGEVRAAMNIVNGWMYTGMGPFYLKDSSTAQNRLAKGVSHLFTGRAAADVLEGVSGLVGVTRGQVAAPPAAPVDPTAQNNALLRRIASLEGNDFVRAVEALSTAVDRQTRVEKETLNYAEIYIYEPELTPDGQMEWSLIAEHHMNRHYTGNTPAGPKMLQQLLSTDMMRTAFPSKTNEASVPAPQLEQIQGTLQEMSQKVENLTTTAGAATAGNSAQLSSFGGTAGLNSGSVRQPSFEPPVTVQATGSGIDLLRESAGVLPAGANSQNVDVRIGGSDGERAPRRNFINRLLNRRN